MGGFALVVGAALQYSSAKMQKIAATTEISGVVGTCGSMEVFLGFAPARLLHAVSFADILDEDTGSGYQRPRNRSHSQDFRQYITRQGSTTIPLTFNLRRDLQDAWQVVRGDNGNAVLRLAAGVRCLAQVDCQHRLGELYECDLPLAFMTFIGLDLRAEMSIFVIINSKAKGLSSSLTDYHESNLLANLAQDAPHLYLARRLNDDPASPWHRLIRYGGETSSGLKRRTSLRMMQKTISRFLGLTRNVRIGTVEDQYAVLLAFWRAVASMFPDEWRDPSHHLITKGVGLYSLTLLLADIVRQPNATSLTEDSLTQCLQCLKGRVNWKSDGMFSEAGGQKGAAKVHAVLRKGVGL
ncbi:MAG: DGQHR domain-containing protein [Phycisphaerae bacterium]|jgi:DGQHR domain-containing protein